MRCIIKQKRHFKEVNMNTIELISKVRAMKEAEEYVKENGYRIVSVTLIE